MRTLYMSLASPYTRKVRVVLAEKGLDFTPQVFTHHELRAPITPGYAQGINPSGRIPALVDDERVLFESNVIVEYLLSEYPETPAAAPRPPLAKTLVRPERRWEDLETLAAIETLLDSGITILRFGTFSGVAQEPSYLAREHDRIQYLLDYLAPRATAEGFAPGTFSIQDLNLIITLQWLEFRKVAAWRGRSTLDALLAFHQARPTLVATQPKLDPAAH